MYDFGIINGELYIDGALKELNIYINKDHIVAINDTVASAKEVYDAKGKWVLPGLIDPHVHFELGNEKSKSVDDFYQGSISAAYGGITTIIDFLDPIDKASEVRDALINRYQLAKRSMIDYTFHVTVKNPVGQVKGIVEEMKRYGMNSIKLFTTYSDSGRRTYDDEIKELLRLSAEDGFVVLAHIEADDQIVLEPSMQVEDLPFSRPKSAEMSMALELCDYAAETGGTLYMVHLSHGETLEALIETHEDVIGEQMIIESCPHYFYLDDTKYSKKEGYLYTMAPPLREPSSKESLLKNSQHISTIGTDHCPYMSTNKMGRSLKDTPMGIGGVEHSFELMHNLIGLAAVDKMSVTPAKIFGLYPKKGSLEIGTDADIMIYDPNNAHVICKDHSASDYSVYEGIDVKGRVESTICKGQFVIKEGALVIGSVGHFIRTRKE